MRILYFFIFLGQLSYFSCDSKELHNLEKPNNDIFEKNIDEIEVTNVTPTVDLAKYKLILDSGIDRKSDANEIIKVKRKWPLAMQSKNKAEFDSILSKDFTFTGHDAFFNREDYIKDRISPQEWIITYVKYENVTLQFVGNTGVLSYVNHITNKSQRTGEIEYEHIAWVDMYVIEDGEWKINAAHAIDYRLEIPVKEEILQTSTKR